RTFSERFAGMPIRIAQLSRLVAAKDAKAIKQELAAGKLDIVIGTHALVAQKERLKRLKSDVHVLTLTATPIPRTLQLALSGVREMSIIATPPIDRLA